MIKKILCLVLVSCIMLSGCGVDNSVIINSRYISPGSNDSYTQDYLSKEICVIPKNKMSTTEYGMTAGSALIINDTKNKSLYAQNIYQKLYPASVTKIVTCLVTLKYANLDDVVTVSHDAANITEWGAQLCGFKEGDKIVLKDLLYCFLLYSGNDAGVAIADHVSGSVKEFAKLMNKEAANLGCANSHFVNPHGLHDKKHYTTAYDLYLVFHELIKYDTFLDIIKTPSFKVKYKDASGKTVKKVFSTTNRYILGRCIPPKGVEVIGGKTGTTSMAGSCLILYSKNKSGEDFISVVLRAPGAESLYSQMNHLLEKI